MNLKKLFFAAVIVLSANAAIAQDTNIATHNVTINIPEYALLDLEGPADNTDISFEGKVESLLPLGNEEAGLPIAFTATNNIIWMNYSSIMGASGPRTVSVKLDSPIPSGLKLTVTNAGDAGNGGGLTSPDTSIITFISTSGTGSQDIVTGIGSAYTGDGVNNGHKLTYELGLEDNATNYENLTTGITALIVTYTLTDIN